MIQIIAGAATHNHMLAAIIMLFPDTTSSYVNTRMIPIIAGSACHGYMIADITMLF